MQSFRTLRKRLKLTIALLLLTLVATVGALEELPWSYQSTGMAILLASKTSTATTGNPYLDMDPGILETANVLCLQLTDTTTTLMLQAHGYTGSYDASVPTTTGAPLIQITVTASSAGEAQNTLLGVMTQVATQLTSLQSNVAAKNRITSRVISTDSMATRQTSKKAKPLVIVFALGLILMFSIPQLVERRSAKKAATRTHADGPSDSRRVGLDDVDAPADQRPVAPAGAYVSEPTPRQPPWDRNGRPQSAEQFPPDHRPGTGQGGSSSWW